MMTTTIYLIRHAKPDFSEKQDDIRPLSQEGLQDCQLINQFFEHRSVDHILSSPYKRAYETIVNLAKQKQLRIVCDERFRERQITNHWIKDFNSFARQQWQDFTYHLPNGEALEQVQQRMLAGLTATLQTYPNQSIVISSHGTAISTIIQYYYYDFDYHHFQQLKDLMPFILTITFEKEKPLNLSLYNLFTREEIIYPLTHQDSPLENPTDK